MPSRCPIRFLVVSAALLLTFALPAHAQEWVEVRSPHFSVYTDAGEARGRQVAERFELMRAAFGVLFRRTKVNLPVPVDIVAFRSTRDFRRFAPLWKGKPVVLTGLFVGGDDRNFIALDMSAPDHWGVVFHEYAHLLIHGNFPPLPTWYDEGFAEYCSSLRVDKKEIQFGLLAEDRARELAQSPWMHIVDLFSVKHESKQYNEGEARSVFYAQSWITVHYIMGLRKGDEISNYLQLTMQKGMSVPDAIRVAFKMEPRQLELAIRDYFMGRRLMYYRTAAPADLGNGPYQVRKMSEAEWMAVLADFHYHHRDHRDEGIAEFREVLKRDPNNVAANRGLGYVYMQQNDFAKAAEHFRRAAAANSQDARVHYLSALLMNREAMISNRPPRDLPAMRREIEAAIQLDPGYADAYNLLAYCEAVAGNPEAAHAAMQKAAELNPGNEYYRLNLAQYKIQARQFDEAEQLLKQLADSGNPEVANAAETQLGQIALMRQAAPLGQVPSSQHVVLTAPQWEKKEAKAEEPQPPPPAEEPPPAPPQMQSIRFVKGKLLSVDCSAPPGAVLTVVAGKTTWQMFTRDRNHVLLIGADSFSCAWTNRSVSINYRLKADGRGEIVSLEID